MPGHAIPSRWRTALGLAALTALWLCGSLAFGQPRSLEYPVKAAYLPKFAPFIDWPPKAFAAPDSPFVICVVGADPFGPLLDKAVRGQRIGRRAFQVRRIATVGRDSGCHVLYVGHRDPHAAAAVLKA
ncbi:MAG TPA: YfiR family protein, partial [Caulobacter sp.]|nr:YfiR family protein [Caulobacter sp.]